MDQIHQLPNEIFMQLTSEQQSNTWLNSVLLRCIELLSKHFNIPDVRSIILTGSLARGEGSISRHETTYFLHSDIEFLVVGSTNRRLDRLKVMSESIKNDISNSLTEEFVSKIEIDLGVVGRDFFQQKMRPSIFAFDLTRFGKVVYGEIDIIKSKYFFPAQDIPQEDALELLMNRAIELMCLNGSRCSEKNPAYSLNKILLDMAGSFLAFTGQYVAPYAKRANALSTLTNTTNWPFSDIPFSEFIQYLQRAVEWKILPDTQPTWSNLIIEKRPEIEIWLSSMILWEIRQMHGNDEKSSKDIIELYKSREQLKDVLKGWLKYFLQPLPKNNCKINVFKVFGQIFCCSPKTIIYSSAIKFQLNQIHNKEFLHEDCQKDLLVFEQVSNSTCFLDKICILWENLLKHK
jgi:predicted nucleotidyltransferase